MTHRALLVLRLTSAQDPYCAFGTAYQGQCECWAGYKGAACDVYDRTLYVALKKSLLFDQQKCIVKMQSYEQLNLSYMFVYGG